MGFPKESLLIEVELSAPEVPIEPGGTAQLTVTITNRQDHDDHVFIEIEGIDVEWYALPVPAVNVAAGNSQSARILFKVARSSESAAGTYPFLVRARGMESGESGVQQAALVIKAFNALQMDLTPKRATATFAHRAQVFDVHVSNLGNQDETLDLYASDPDDGCAYEFETSRITLKPGRSEVVPMRVEPVTQPVFGVGRLFSFVITARSVEDSYVSCNVTGQIERRAFVSPFVAALLLLILAGFGSWALFRPRPVVIESFTESPAQVTRGQAITLAWVLGNFGRGAQAYIKGSDNTTIPVSAPAGSVKVTPDLTTTYELVAQGGGKTDRRTSQVIVVPGPKPLAPRISSFTASRELVHQGDTVTLTWSVDRAKVVALDPLGKSNDPRLWNSQEVQPPADTTYILHAQGPGGVVSRSVKVHVVPITESTAEIHGFKVKPDTIHVGEQATLSWSVGNASDVQIDNGVGGGLKPKDKFIVSPSQTTTYTLSVSDDKGNRRTRQVTLTVLPAEPPPPSQSETNPQSPPGAPTPSTGGEPSGQPPH